MKTDETPGGAPAAPPAAPTPAATSTKAPHRTVTLSDGRTAHLRKPIGRDIARGSIVSGGVNQTAMMMGIAACVTTIDGKGITYEQLEEMDAVDVMMLTGELGKDLFPGLATLLGSQG